jgi:hypothetical protein
MARKATSVDDDAPEITAELFAQMRPMKDLTPGMVGAVKAAKHGWLSGKKVRSTTKRRTANRKMEKH